MSSQHPQFVQPGLSFDQLLQSASLPNPGPEYYAARRKLWLTSPPSSVTRPTPSSSASASRQKLQDVTSQPGAVYDQDIWDRSLEKVWKGLSSGGKLRVSLPLATVIQIIHAAWLRDNTWPVGMEVRDSGDEQQPEDPPSETVPSATTTSTPQPACTQRFESLDALEPINPRTTTSRT